MSLRSRIVLAVTAVFAVVSLFTGWLMLDHAEKSLRIAFDRTTQTRADWLLSQISTDPVVLPLPTDRERMQVLYQAYGQTRELFKSPGFPNKPVSTHRRRHVGERPYSYRAITSQVSTEQAPDGRIVLTLAVPDINLQQDITRLRLVFGIGWLLSLGLAFIGGYGVAGWLLRPIQSIVDQANTISNATDSSRIALPKTKDELYQLTDTLNRMLSRIRENIDLQRNFFGAAAHELRTPLTIMKTGLEVTLDNERVDESLKPFLAGQLDEVSRLSRLLDEFLTLSRPEDTAQTLRLSEVNIPQLVKKCLNQLVILAAEYDVDITVEFGEPTAETYLTDAVKLEHVLLNLIENAIKYAVSGTYIHVSVAYDYDWIIRIQNQTVRADGPTLGLVQPYFQADPLKEGHGLGLWISHRLTMLLGGKLRLEWQSFTFTSELSLPITINQHSFS
ncbi:HAMP domain-containing sensor histidine kinase [Spirosoma sp.]|uniref:sensor histidine kinase n=1 Tax=Spirosoma sp. TaxID=1899569 RepID=UPI00260FEF0F|nr:HAMP domain-containing sensor histidine kinase [Spirosoma sp.]MCX6217121.1 HAMP domain-containing sensor histidine kinase [Spirosoma sp.]